MAAPREACAVPSAVGLPLQHDEDENWSIHPASWISVLLRRYGVVRARHERLPLGGERFVVPLNHMDVQFVLEVYPQRCLRIVHNGIVQCETENILSVLRSALLLPYHGTPFADSGSGLTSGQSESYRRVSTEQLGTCRSEEPRDAHHWIGLVGQTHVCHTPGRPGLGIAHTAPVARASLTALFLRGKTLFLARCQTNAARDSSQLTAPCQSAAVSLSPTPVCRYVKQEASSLSAIGGYRTKATLTETPPVNYGVPSA